MEYSVLLKVISPNDSLATLNRICFLHAITVSLGSTRRSKGPNVRNFDLISALKSENMNSIALNSDE